MYEKFEALLRKHDITPYQVSKITGIASSTLTEWKKGNYTPKADKLIKIAIFFKVPLVYFYGDETKKGNVV